MDEAALVIKGDEVRVARAHDGRIDLALVDRLARLALEAHRRGEAIYLHDPPLELRALLELCGLADLLPECDGGNC